jgi:hypothetical protein
MARFPTAGGRAAACVASVLAVATTSAGCGGGPERPSGTNTGTVATRTDGEAPKPSPGRAGQKPPRVGTVIRDFRARLASPGRIEVSATVTRRTRLALRVIRLTPPNPIQLGQIDYGTRQGRVSVSWDLKVGGRRVPAGRYRLRLVGGKGAGRSRPVVMSLPAG